MQKQCSDHPTPLIACRQCDLLCGRSLLRTGGLLPPLWRPLYRNAPDSLNRTLSLSLAAMMLFIIANVYPILGIEVQGIRNITNLYGAVDSLWNRDMFMISALVFVTTILVPAIELTVMIYLLMPLCLGRTPRGIAPILRLLQSIKPGEWLRCSCWGPHRW
jgi:paraquat-inducible protein A